MIVDVVYRFRMGVHEHASEGFVDLDCISNAISHRFASRIDRLFDVDLPDQQRWRRAVSTCRSLALCTTLSLVVRVRWELYTH